MGDLSWAGTAWSSEDDDRSVEGQRMAVAGFKSRAKHSGLTRLVDDDDGAVYDLASLEDDSLRD